MAGGTETQLERTPGLKEVLTIGVGAMAGVGISVLPDAAALAGPASAAAFDIAGAVAMLTALSASELATPEPPGEHHTRPSVEFETAGRATPTEGDYT